MYVRLKVVYMRVCWNHYPALCRASGAVSQQIATLIDELRAEETQVQLNVTKNLHRMHRYHAH